MMDSENMKYLRLVETNLSSKNQSMSIHLNVEIYSPLKSKKHEGKKQAMSSLDLIGE